MNPSAKNDFIILFAFFMNVMKSNFPSKRTNHWKKCNGELVCVVSSEASRMIFA
jgi:hypothetical protein